MLEPLRDAVDRMRTALERTDPDAPIPACPSWTVAALAEHLGGVHLWAAAALQSPTFPGWKHPRRSRGSEPLADWYAGCAATLLDALEASDPSQPAWTFDANDQTAGFWRRRQLHETTIHRVDVEQAGGHSQVGGIDGVPTEVAADGVDEVLTVMMPRTLARRRKRPALDVLPVPRPLAVVCPDAERAWTVQVVEDMVFTRPGVHDPVATITAPAAPMLLALWNRAPRAGLDITGEQEAAEAFLGAQLTP